MNNTKKSPQRMCVACRKMFDKKDLVRVVRSPEGVVSVDITGKKNGRGAYVCASDACAQKCRKGVLQKHLGCEIPAEIFAEIEAAQHAKG